MEVVEQAMDKQRQAYAAAQVQARVGLAGMQARAQARLAEKAAAVANPDGAGETDASGDQDARGGMGRRQRVQQ